MVEILEDYVCPYRDRVVLRKGCVYGAPLYVQAIQYHFEGHSTTRHLESLVRDISDTPEQKLKAKHEALVALTEASEFTYHVKAQRLDLNGKVFIKGIAAEILTEVLVIHISSGGTRSTFEFAYFKKYKGFSIGFEVHLGRIQKTLKKKSLTIRISPVAKGTFKLEADAPIRINYVD